jgi:hypothetical protein
VPTRFARHRASRFDKNAVRHVISRLRMNDSNAARLAALPSVAVRLSIRLSLLVLVLGLRLGGAVS